MAITETQFHFKGLHRFYRGKVRDVYEVDDHFIVVATDRISAFDHILPRAIPFKGQVLNQLARYFLTETSDLVPNWLRASPDPNVSIGVKCEPIPLEMVIRGYLAGHAWRTYRSGKRSLCGVSMPEGMHENDPFSKPIITPATKAAEGHDEDISRNEILKKEIVDEDTLDKLEHYTRKLFERGQQMAKDRGLILVDTKYEFGRHNGEIVLMDEIHTPDSSRYFYLDGFQDRQKKGLPQEQLSKEFVREWLMTEGFRGLEGQEMPQMTNTLVSEISERYIQLYETLTGKKFERRSYDDILTDIFNNILRYLDSHR